LHGKGTEMIDVAFGQHPTTEKKIKNKPLSEILSYASYVDFKIYSTGLQTY
jgi:hypothetical protein